MDAIVVYKSSNGQILCFLDDDAPPFPEWLNALVKGFSNPSDRVCWGAGYP